MSGGHAAALYRPGDTPAHRLPAHCKLVAVFAFVLVVATTPREELWAFAVYAVLLGAVAAVARIPAGFIVRRALVEAPFVLFAVALPFLSSGPATVVAGVSLSVSGLFGAFNILAKATLGVVAAVLLSATTPIGDVLSGMARLRIPPTFVMIASFMVRYVAVVSGELARMRLAMASRGLHSRSPRRLAAAAGTAGALFVRTYERGERVYVAMLSRGYAGGPTAPTGGAASPGAWARALVLPGSALLVGAAAWTLRLRGGAA
ncbi:cobalt ECF transporter T component CbiQ [Streptomonospora salina]|uniref:Cobalt/nickel transport system permease protein n=1 Tax=Streptomonospora salina TaxID=104205 RepID=A0A841E5T1_9ACTN|nr:cobalt ECF transporter T component CbiQ [Streptomonospora salina]MBB5998142.1 cobalt/nickel transport system permease protein [Streptomonospora salina]